MALEEAINTRLRAVVAVTSLLPSVDAITPMNVEQGATTQTDAGAAVTYQRISREQHPAMGSTPNVVTSRMQVDCWAPTHDAAAALAKQVRIALDRYRGTPYGTDEILDSMVENEFASIDSETRMHRRAVDFIIHHRE